MPDRHGKILAICAIFGLMSLMFEICLTFTPRKAKIMLLSPNMRPFCWRHRGSIADRSPGWITISPPPLSLSAVRLPARVGTQWVQMSYGPQMVSSSRLYRDNRPTRLSTIGIRLVNGFDEWSPDLASNLQHNQLQSISIGETYW